MACRGAASNQEHLGFAVFEAWSEDPIHRVHRSFCHQPNVVRWIGQFHQNAIGVLRFLGIEHPGSNAHPNFLTQRLLGPKLLCGVHHVRGDRLLDQCSFARRLLQPQISTQLIRFHFFGGLPRLHKMQLQMASQMHIQMRPELNVACSWPCIDTTTFQHLT